MEVVAIITTISSSLVPIHAKRTTMQPSDIISLIALVVALAALCISVYQAFVGQRSLEPSRRAIKHSLRSTHLTLLPKANFVIYLRTKLEKWIKHLEHATQQMHRAAATEDPHLLVALSEGAPQSAQDIIDRPMYELSPEWLRVLLTCGAQHYYAAVCNFHPLSEFQDADSGFGFTSDLIQRCGKSHFYLKELLSYVDELVPEAYLQCPASIKDEAFLTL